MQAVDRLTISHPTTGHTHTSRPCMWPLGRWGRGGSRVARLESDNASQDQDQIRSVPVPLPDYLAPRHLNAIIYINPAFRRCFGSPSSWIYGDYPAAHLVSHKSTDIHDNVFDTTSQHHAYTRTRKEDSNSSSCTEPLAPSAEPRPTALARPAEAVALSVPHPLRQCLFFFCLSCGIVIC